MATLRREHVRRVRGEVRLAYPAKGGQWRELAPRDAEIHRLIGALLRRGRAVGMTDLLVFREKRSWYEVRAEHVNAYLKELAGDEFSAKDPRTWNATVLAAVALARTEWERAGTVRGRKKLLTACYREVSEHLGNTPTVARQSYVDPRVAAAFESGRTVERAVHQSAQCARGPEETRDIIELAVVQLRTEI